MLLGMGSGVTEGPMPLPQCQLRNSLPLLLEPDCGWRAAVGEVFGPWLRPKSGGKKGIGPTDLPKSNL